MSHTLDAVRGRWLSGFILYIFLNSVHGSQISKEGGWRKKPWWQQEAPDEVPRAMLEEASREACLRHRLWDTPQVETGRGVGRCMHPNSR